MMIQGDERKRRYSVSQEFPCWFYHFKDKKRWEDCKNHNPDCYGMNRVCLYPTKDIIVNESLYVYKDLYK